MSLAAYRPRWFWIGVWGLVAGQPGCRSQPLDVIVERSGREPMQPQPLIPPTADASIPSPPRDAAARPTSIDDAGSNAALVQLPDPPLFDTPLAIEALADPAFDDDPTVTGDWLELYFATQRTGDEDIWVSRRATRTDAWGPPEPVVELNSEFWDATPGISTDGLSIWFESTRASGDLDADEMATDIWVSRRTSPQEPWSTPTLVTELNSDARDSAPQPSSPWLMTFSAIRPDGIGNTDIFATSRPSVFEPWSTASRLAGVSSSSWDQGLIRADGSQIFMSSGRDRGGLFWSFRPSPDSPFQPPVPLDSLNERGEQDLWVSEDLTYAVFSSERSGNQEIYEAFRIE